MAGRFKLLSDEHWSKAHRKAGRAAGWDVVRVVDVDELGEDAPDPQLLAHCAAHGYVWVTRDEAALGHVTEWIESGKALPGVIIAPQRHHISPGSFVRFLEKLAQEEAPFVGVIRYLPSGGE